MFFGFGPPTTEATHKKKVRRMPILGPAVADTCRPERSGGCRVSEHTSCRRAGTDFLPVQKPLSELWKLEVVLFHTSKGCLMGGSVGAVRIGVLVEREQDRKRLFIDGTSLVRAAELLERDPPRLIVLTGRRLLDRCDLGFALFPLPTLLLLLVSEPSIGRSPVVLNAVDQKCGG